MGQLDKAPKPPREAVISALTASIESLSAVRQQALTEFTDTLRNGLTPICQLMVDEDIFPTTAVEGAESPTIHLMYVPRGRDGSSTYFTPDARLYYIPPTKSHTLDWTRREELTPVQCARDFELIQSALYNTVRTAAGNRK